MNDLFERITLKEFLSEEHRAIIGTRDIGLLHAAIGAGELVAKFTSNLVASGVLSAALNQSGTYADDVAHGRETIVRAGALLMVMSALGLRDMMQRAGIDEDLPEIDLVVSWYRGRWKR